MPYAWLSAEKALIFRITHIDNVRWILENGLHCRNGERDPSFVTIGEPEIIERRNERSVPVDPGGTLPTTSPSTSHRSLRWHTKSKQVLA